MLKVLRHKGVAKKVLWFISGIIIISFGFGFGMSRYSSQVSLTDTAGKAFGQKISLKEFQQKYLDTRDMAMLIHGDNFREVSKMIDLDSETWSRLILVKEADQRKIKAADAEVIAFIQNIPLFQRDGAFDRKAYDKVVRYSFQREPRFFEEGIRDQIKIMKMFRSETMGLNLSDEAVRKEFERRNQKIKVSYVLIDPKTFNNVINLNDKELQDYFDQHRDEFLEPDSVNVQYATFAFAPQAAKDEKKAILDKANAFYSKTTSTADFAAAAKTAGAEVKETGFFNMEQPELGINWSLELLQKVFQAKAGDRLDPVETEAGVQVLEIAEKKPAYIPPFEKAKDTVKNKLLAEKTLILAKEKAAEAQKTLAAKTSPALSFDTAVKNIGLEKKTTPFFALGEYIPEIGISEDFAAAAFATTKEQPLSAVVLTSRGPVILYWESLQPIDEKKFAEVKKDFTETMYEEQKRSAMNRVIKEIKEKAGLETYLDKVKRKDSGRSR